MLKAFGRLKKPKRCRKEGERHMSEKAVLFETNPSSENEKGFGSSSKTSSRPRAGLSGEHETREFVQVAWWANTLNRVDLTSWNLVPSSTSVGLGDHIFFRAWALNAAGIFLSFARDTSLLKSSCGIETRGSSWTLKGRSISGRNLTKLSIIPFVAFCCHSPPPAALMTLPSRIKIPSSALSCPRACRALSRMTDGVKAQNGSNEWYMVSYSSMSSTPFHCANSNHLSKLGGGGILYFLLYSWTALPNERDCLLLSSSNSFSAVVISWCMGWEVPAEGRRGFVTWIDVLSAADEGDRGEWLRSRCKRIIVRSMKRQRLNVLIRWVRRLILLEVTAKYAVAAERWFMEAVRGSSVHSSLYRTSSARRALWIRKDTWDPTSAQSAGVCFSQGFHHEDSIKYGYCHLYPSLRRGPAKQTNKVIPRCKLNRLEFGLARHTELIFSLAGS